MHELCVVIAAGEEKQTTAAVAIVKQALAVTIEVSWAAVTFNSSIAWCFSHCDVRTQVRIVFTVKSRGRLTQIAEFCIFIAT